MYQNAGSITMRILTYDNDKALLQCASVHSAPPGQRRAMTRGPDSGYTLARHRYLHFDVSPDHPFTGNQLAVFPNAAGLDSDVMQRIAAEIGFSETSFVFPAETTTTDVRVRIFTPAVELTMGG